MKISTYATNVTIRKRMKRGLFLALILITCVAIPLCASAEPAHGRRGGGDRDWNNHARESHRHWRGRGYDEDRGYIYSPPVVYAPPPVYEAPGINLVVPLNFR